jgi:hypothetical protein
MGADVIINEWNTLTAERVWPKVMESQEARQEVLFTDSSL